MTTPEQAERPLSPPDDGLSRAEEAQQERREDAAVAQALADDFWWEMELMGDNVTSDLVPPTLAAIAPYYAAAWRDLQTVPLTQVASVLLIMQALKPLMAAATARARKEAQE